MAAGRPCLFVGEFLKINRQALRRPKRGAAPKAATAGEAEEADRRGAAEGVLDFKYGLRK